MRSRASAFFVCVVSWASVAAAQVQAALPDAETVAASDVSTYIVPEPTLLALLGLGLFVVAARLRRRRRVP